MEAAEILNCSFMELESHPDRVRLMTIAQTVKSGRNNGEYLLKCNPKFHMLVKNATDEIDRAKGNEN